MNNEIKVEANFADTGELRVGVKLTEEQIEVLRSLNDSPQWKLYREVLIGIKTEYFNSTLAIDETNKVMKQMGMVAGVNIAINQLPVLIGHLDNQRKKEEAIAIRKEKNKNFKRR